MRGADQPRLEGRGADAVVPPVRPGTAADRQLAPVPRLHIAQGLAQRDQAAACVPRLGLKASTISHSAMFGIALSI